jgi:hypothetical protein
VIVVKQVGQVRLLPTPEQVSALTETLHARGNLPGRFDET